MKKVFKQNNGITLIALVITIIVMLILVAVTVNMTVNGGLFGYAGNAAKDTETAKKEELKIANGKVTVDGITYESMDAYELSLNCKHNWVEEEITKEATCMEEGEHIVICTICGVQKKETIKKENHKFANNDAWEIIPEEGKEKNTCTTCGEVIKRYIVGATIKGYDPTNNNTISTSYTSLGSFDSSTQGEFGDGSTGNGYSDQKFILTKVNSWQILGEDDNHIIIVPKTNLQLYPRFKGRSGYTYCIDEIEHICSIYGQGKYADTSKFDLTEDVTNTDGTFKTHKTTKNASGARCINVQDLKYLGYNITSASYTFRKDEINKRIYNEKITSGPGTSTTFWVWNKNTKEELNNSDWVELNDGESVTLIDDVASISGSVSSRAYKCLMGEYPGYHTYYIAARNLQIPTNSDQDAYCDRIEYGVRFIFGSYGNVNRMDSLCSSAGTEPPWAGQDVRPAVYLKSDLNISYDAEKIEYTINN